MNRRTRELLGGTTVSYWLARLLTLGLLALWCPGWLIAEHDDAAFGLTAHEWGTFTAVAGNDGNAVEWAPLTGSTDLPGFVEHFSNANFKVGLRGTIRMETPVLYFYAPQDATVSVSVAFSKGVITEWYPHAVRVQPTGVLRDTDLGRLQTDGSITWENVAISPGLSGEFPQGFRVNRYYAARETSSTPLHVHSPAGDQQEKFLFYRGVSAASPPLSARQNTNGGLLVKVLDDNEIPAIISFERRGERVGYRLVLGPTEETAVEPPVLTGSLDSLCGDLEGILVDQGLYADEAHAMVETWRDTWFEEGSRVLYIVPRRFIDKILPLTIAPAPSQIVRVFVGRLEIVTPATTEAVKTALASSDEVALNKYGRFLEPILQRVRAEHSESTQGGGARP